VVDLAWLDIGPCVYGGTSGLPRLFKILYELNP
jgi:hypothetical protein